MLSFIYICLKYIFGPISFPPLPRFIYDNFLPRSDLFKSHKQDEGWLRWQSLLGTGAGVFGAPLAISAARSGDRELRLASFADPRMMGVHHFAVGF